MNFSLFAVLFFSCIAIATCGKDCAWTGCEGKLRSGASVCQEYYRPHYAAQTDGRGCGVTAEKVYCCSLTPSRPGCQWSGCYGTAYNGAYACKKEFGAGYSVNDQVSCQFYQTKYECCK